MFNFVFIYYVIFVLNVFLINAQISDKRLCANQDCTVPISRAKTLMRYGSPDSRILSFAPNEDVTIYSKSAGSRVDLWGVEIRGKRGYVPKAHIREYKIYTTAVTYLVDTEENKTASQQVPSDRASDNEQVTEKPSPDPVQQAYEVVDGTTIYLNPEDAIKLSTESPALPHSDNLSQQKTQPLKPAEPVDKAPPFASDSTQEKNEGPTEAALKTEKPNNNEKTEETIIESEKTAGELANDESLVKNVLSSITNWINEGSGSEITAEEDDDEDGEEDEDEGEDGEIEDENEDAEEEDELPAEVQETEDQKELNNAKNENIKEEQHKGENKKLEEQNVEKLAVDDDSLNIETVRKQEEKISNIEENLRSSVEELNGDQNSNTSNENLQQGEMVAPNVKVQPEVQTNAQPENNSPNFPFNNLNQANTNQVPIVNSVPADIVLQDAGIHAQYTTEEPNFEIPSPLDEVTLNPADSTPSPISSQETPKDETTPDITSKIVATNEDNSKIATHQTQPEDNSELLELSGENPNPKTVSEVFEKQENLIQQEQGVTTEEPEELKEQFENVKEVGEQPIEKHEEKQIEENIDNSVIQKTNDQSEESTETQVLTEQIEEIFDTTVAQELKQQTEENVNIEGQEAKDIPEQQAQPEADVLQPEVENLTESPQEPGGIFSGIYSNMFGNTASENGAAETSGDQDINIKTSEDSNVNEGTPEETAQQIESNVEVNQEANEPSARDILWGSSIRKEIEEKTGKHEHDFNPLLSRHPRDELSCAADPSLSDCVNQHEHLNEQDTATEEDNNTLNFIFPPITYEVLTVLVITAVTVVVFLWGYIYIDKSRKEGPLIAKINNLEKQFLVSKKETEILTEKLSQVENDAYNQSETVSNEVVENLKDELLEAQTTRISLEEQIQTLEKELENSMEVGLELNRMLADFLKSENGSDTLIANVDQLQRQLIEQQGIINTYNENLSIKETENHELRLELEIINTKVTDLQSELNKMALNLLKLEEDKEQSQSNYEAEINSLKEQLEGNSVSFKTELTKLTEELKNRKQKHEQAQRDLDLKTNEYKLLKENITHIEKGKNNGETLKSLFDLSSIEAELIQLRKEKEILTEHLQQEINSKCVFEKQTQVAVRDAQLLKAKYDDADREKVEAQTKLEVLSNYFKDREAHLQKELNKQESMWVEKQGEATSTIERIKYMQEEMQNYKAQNESLKQEIVAQEVQLKSQISVLEKRAHENWVAARQAERKLEDAKHESAQLRNRLTLRERNLNDEKTQNRLQSPLEQNGELPVSPMHLQNDTPASPSLLYGTRDHLTTSPPIPGLPHFLPPPGVPFMPPPLGGVPMPPPGFMPLPPSMIPGDHRPPPLGRMSSPPLNSRYSPDTRAFSPYSRNSPSPTSDDDYGRSSPPPPVYRGYSPYNKRDERREFNRPPPIRSNNRNHKGVAHSSGSANSNESLEKINRHNSKV